MDEHVFPSDVRIYSKRFLSEINANVKRFIQAAGMVLHNVQDFIVQRSSAVADTRIANATDQEL